jgi:hypothetical protein
MDFAQVETKVTQLRQDLAAGQLTEEQFKARLREMMVEDEAGNWWMVGYETGEWYRHDGDDWVRADPPDHLSSIPTPRPAPQTPVSGQAKPRPLLGIVVFLVTEAVLSVVGFGFGLAVAEMIYDGRDNPFTWICWGAFVLGGLAVSYSLARKAWRGK